MPYTKKFTPAEKKKMANKPMVKKAVAAKAKAMAKKKGKK